MNIFAIKKREELALVFDIGSSTISGTLFRMGRDGIPKIVFSTVERLPIEKRVRADRFLHASAEALGKVSERVCLKGLGAPKRVFCVLSSPWFASQTRTVKVRKAEPFLFTKKMADEIVQKEIHAFEEEHLPGYGNESGAVESIELKNMQTKLNGYPTHSPFNQKASSAELHFLFSVAATDVLDAFREAIRKHFHHESIKFSSFMMASFTVARDIFINQESFILVNIGGEVTDISMIKNEVLCESISFPLGENFIVREVAKKTDSTLDDTLAHLSLYKSGHLEEKFGLKFGRAVEDAKGEWLRNFQEFLSRLTNDISIPSTVFVTADPAVAEFFADTIRNEQFNQYILTESKFRVIFLGEQALHGIAELPMGLVRDPGAIIDCIYINRFLG